jgi:CBS domain-containing protein
MAIGEICNRQVVFANRDATVRQAAQLMRELHVGTVVVTDGPEGRRVPCGIVTDRDIVVGVLAKELDPDALKLSDVMGTELVTARDADGVAETVEVMRSKGVRRLPVVDAQGVLVGIVTFDDILELLAEEMSALARMVSREQKREADFRR